MKKNITVIVLLILFRTLYSAASAQNNYIQTNHHSDTQGNIAYFEKVYYDGLGYPEQMVAGGYTPLKRDLAAMYEYDTHKRQNKTWLPVPTLDSTGRYVTPSALKTRSGSIYSDENAYRETIFEDNTLDRLSKIYNPGEVFRSQNKFVRTTYAPNVANEVRIIDVDLYMMSFMANRYYDAYTLVKKGTQNEDGMQTFDYTDRAGRTVMTRVVDGDKNLDTYYGYDLSGRLILVIPPEGSANLPSTSTSLYCDADSFIGKYCYFYHYDSNGFPYERTTPGGHHEQLRYDTRGRLIRRFREQRVGNAQYSDLYTYDSFNRMKERWVVTLFVAADYYGGKQFIEPNDLDSVRSSARMIYTNPVVKNRYDSYDSIPSQFAFKAIGRNMSYNLRPKGLKTFEQLRMLEGLIDLDNAPDYLERALYYDHENRLIERVERNHFGGISYYAFEYDLQSRIIKRTEQIQPEWGASVDTYTVENTYDHAGRLTKETAKLNSGPLVQTLYTYNELGQLVRKESGPIADVYTYNTQGWLTGQQNDYFKAALHYYSPRLGTPASYSGNISEWDWQHGNGDRQTYGFSYDDLSRLKNTVQYRNDTLSERYVEKALTYDRNGNLLTLTRIGADSLADNLVYSYSACRLDSVSGKAYAYDLWGNMIRDGRNDLEISYNYINLPYEIKRSDTELVRYQYYADGTKFSALDADGSGLIYLGSLAYNLTKWNNPRLESGSFAGGRFHVTSTASGQLVTPLYYGTDHLGSTRAIVDSEGEVQEQRDYYPFGMPWAQDEAVTTNRYLFNGKERQWIAEAGLLDYGARFYDPYIGRWQTQDPLADEYNSISPYAYCMNNPMKYIDPHGSIIVDARGSILYENGNWTEAALGTDAMRLGNAMMLTKVGTEIFQQLAADPTLVTININSDIRKTEFGIALGSTDHINSGKSKRAIITIYEGSINEYIKPDNNFSDREKKEMMRISSSEERLGAVGSHEGFHVLDKSGSNREENAVAAEKAYLRESERKHPIIGEERLKQIFSIRQDL